MDPCRLAATVVQSDLARSSGPHPSPVTRRSTGVSRRPIAPRSLAGWGRGPRRAKTLFRRDCRDHAPRRRNAVIGCRSRQGDGNALRAIVGVKDFEKEAACFRSGRGIAYRGAVVWTQLYSKVPTEMLGVRSDAAPTSDWPGLFIDAATDRAYRLTRGYPGKIARYSHRDHEPRIVARRRLVCRRGTACPQVVAEAPNWPNGRFAWTTQARCAHTHSRSSKMRLDFLKDKARRDYTLNPRPLVP